MDRFGKHPHVDFVVLPDGLETIAQTQTLIEYLRNQEISTRTLGLVSTWHQVLRAGAVFLASGYNLPHLMPIVSPYSTSAYDILVSGLAGIGYSFVTAFLQKHGYWVDGGPLVRIINEERTNRNSYSWFNTTIR